MADSRVYFIYSVTGPGSGFVPLLGVDIDLSDAAAQPMHTPDGRYALTTLGDMKVEGFGSYFGQLVLPGDLGSDASYALCDHSRWYPAVIPQPVKTYITKPSAKLTNKNTERFWRRGYQYKKRTYTMGLMYPNRFRLLKIQT